MGYNTKRTLESDMELRLAYETYLSCREQHVVTYQGKKGKDTVQKMKTFTVGFHHLPDEGGLLDQPHRLMTFMDAFLQGDRQGFAQDKR